MQEDHRHQTLDRVVVLSQQRLDVSLADVNAGDHAALQRGLQLLELRLDRLHRLRGLAHFLEEFVRQVRVQVEQRRRDFRKILFAHLSLLLLIPRTLHCSCRR